MDIPTQAFSVQKKFLDEIIYEIRKQVSLPNWVPVDRTVVVYVARKLGVDGLAALGTPSGGTQAQRFQPGDQGELGLEIPFPLVALVIAHVLNGSDSAYVLAFLLGCKEIMVIDKILQDPTKQLLGHNSNEETKLSIYILYSQISVKRQQQIFVAIQPGVRWITEVKGSDLVSIVLLFLKSSMQKAQSLPVLAALIAIAAQPNFAMRTSEREHRASQEVTVTEHHDQLPA
ncbi:ATP-dependent RNA helicase A [Tulasnella sp. 330]|nr:ATP-dependent RNA helicase A [Tulasnella sp. 330]